MKRKCTLLLGVAIAVTLAGCGGLPKPLVEQANSQEAKIAEAKSFIAEREKELPGLTAGDRAWLANYAQRENWAAKVSEAKAEVERLSGVHKTTLMPLIEANESETEPKVSAEIQRIASGLASAKDNARYPSVRAGELTKLREELPQVKEQATADYEFLVSLSTPLQAFIAEAKGRHPGRANDIDSRTAIATKLASDAKTANDVVLAEAGKHQAGQVEDATDYAAFGNGAKAIATALQSLQTEDKRIRTELAELDKSWSRTLVDMKQRYFLQVEQVSWNESSDFNTEVPHTRPEVEVTAEVFEQAATMGEEDLLATYGSAFFSSSFQPKASSAILAAVNLNEATATEGFDGGNSAEYWISEWRVDCYHKYLEESEGKTTETDWVLVDEEDFAEQVDNLGMTLASKPYGVFADEVEDTPAPPGMAYVGNEKYGQWKTDSSGNSFWEFYGQYMFISHLLGPNTGGYYRNDWDSYRKDRDEGRTYYGGTATAPRFGSSGSHMAQSGRFASSTFAKSGGASRAHSTLRSAGVSARAGGPGGGGK